MPTLVRALVHIICMDNVNCGGHEVNLTASPHQYTSGGVYNNGIDVHNCAPGKEAGVKCDGMWNVTKLWFSCIHSNINCRVQCSLDCHLIVSLYICP